MEKGLDKEPSAMSVFVITFFGTALAELSSVPFYYPFDLIKVRM